MEGAPAVGGEPLRRVGATAEANEIHRVAQRVMRRADARSTSQPRASAGGKATRQMKEFTRRWHIAALGALALVVLGAVACTPETSVTVASPGGQTGISVSGEGAVSVPPDIAVLALGASATDQTVAAARDRAAVAMQAIVDAAKGNGVDEKDIRTTSFNIYPQYSYSEDKGQQITGYQVTNLASIIVRDIDQVSAVLDAVATAGGDLVRVDNVTFTVENPDQFLSDARTQALENARAHADELAAAAGVTLGQPLSIVESSGGFPPPQPMFAEGGAAARDQATPVSPGEQKLTVMVSVVYAIEQ